VAVGALGGEAGECGQGLGSGEGGDVFGLLLGGAAAAVDERAGGGRFEDVEQLGEGEGVALGEVVEGEVGEEVVGEEVGGDGGCGGGTGCARGR